MVERKFALVLCALLLVPPTSFADTSSRFQAELPQRNKYVRQHPNDPDGYAQRASTYLNLQQFSAALKDQNSALALRPNDYLTLVQRGDTNARLGRDRVAAEDYDRAIAINPERAEAYLARGLFKHTHLLDEVGADQDMSKSISIDPNNWRSYHWRSALYAAMRKKDQAFKDMRQAVKLNPQGHVLEQAGDICDRFHEYEEAVKYFDRAIKAEPDNTGFLQRRAKLMVRMKRFDDAIADLSQAIKFRRDEPSLYADRARSYIMKQNFKKALDDLNSAEKLHLNDENIYVLRAEVHASLKEYPQAIEDYTTSLRKDPIHCDQVLPKRARVYDLMGRHDLAARDRQEAREETIDLLPRSH